MAAALQILYEDDALLFVDKPPNIVVPRGYDPDEVVTWLDRVQRLRTKHEGWPESRWQSLMVSRFAQ